MRLTSSRAYTRPAPTPRMPPGLVELMEGLTRDVLKNNPEDIYEFCAGHMEKLINLRNASLPKNKLTLEEKIKLAQDKIRQKINERRLQYDKEMLQHSDVTNDKEETVTKLEKPSLLEVESSDSLRRPAHHEEVILDNEVEISHEPNVTIKRTDISEIEQNQQHSSNDVVLDSAKIIDALSNGAKDELKSNTAVITPDSVVTRVSDELPNKVEQNISDSNEDDQNGVDNKEEIKDNEHMKQNVSDSIEPAVQSDKLFNEIQKFEEKGFSEENIADLTSLPTAIDDATEHGGQVEVHESPVRREMSLEGSTNNIQMEEETTDNLNSSTLEEKSIDQKNMNDIDTDNKEALPGNLAEVENEESTAEIIKESKNMVNNDVGSVSRIAVIGTSGTASETNLLQSEESLFSQEVPQHENIFVMSAEKSYPDSVMNNVDSKQEFEAHSVDTKKKETENDTDNEKAAVDFIREDAILPQGQFIGQVSSKIETIDKEDRDTVKEPIQISEKSIESKNDHGKNNKIELKNFPQEGEKNINEAILVSKSENIPKELHDNIQELTGIIFHDAKQPDSDTNQSLISDSMKIDVYKATEQSKNYINHDHHADNGNVTGVVSTVDNIPEQSEILSTELFVKENGVQDNQSGSVIENDEPAVSGMDLETAAITIQKVFRTFLFSKSRTSTLEDTVNEISLDEDLEKEKDAPDYIMSAANLNKERRTLGISRMDTVTVLQTVNEEKSLSLSTDDSSTLSSAATTIQAHVRGFLVRNRLASYKTSSTSLVNSEGPSTISLDGDTPEPKKTILNIHIVPERGQFMSRDESMLTSIDLPLDNSPPSSINLHPLGYDKSEPRKQLKREDAIQSISPPSNNSGKLSEEVDSVKDADGNSIDLKQESEISTVSLASNYKRQDVDAEGCDTTLTISSTADTVVDVADVYNTTESSPENHSQADLKNKEDTNLSSDEMDVVTPFPVITEKITSPQDADSEDKSKLLHSGEFHDMVVQTQVKRSESSVVRGE